MRTAIVFNHPYEGSYCNAILNAVAKGLQNAHHEVDLIHLDNDGFYPVMSQADLKAFVEHQPIDPQVIDYNKRLKKADHLIFPIWGDIMPATTKGFIDRVLLPYSLLIGNLIRRVMLRSVFKTMGYRNLKWISFTSVKAVSQENQVKWLDNLENRFSRIN